MYTRERTGDNGSVEAFWDGVGRRIELGCENGWQRCQLFLMVLRSCYLLQMVKVELVW